MRNPTNILKVVMIGKRFSLSLFSFINMLKQGTEPFFCIIIVSDVCLPSIHGEKQTKTQSEV